MSTSPTSGRLSVSCCLLMYSSMFLSFKLFIRNNRLFFLDKVISGRISDNTLVKGCKKRYEVVAWIVTWIHMIEHVVVVLHHAYWQRVVDVDVEDVVQFPCLELNQMWQQCLDKLQTVLGKLFYLLDTNSCSDSDVQSFLALVSRLTHVCVFPSKLQSAIHVSLPNLCHDVLSCQYDGLCQDYAVDLVCLDKVQIGAWPC